MDKKAEKEHKKALKKQWQLEQQELFDSSLPMTKELFTKLFDALDKHLEENNCNHTNTFSRSFLEELKINNTEEVLEWMREHGGYCDCEILYNVEECFD